ncbi:MAG TPA: multicopper oxidase domain-containing protein [Steroidobacteraceae bacterium]|nr:multicopper oxidase domain-containing protein [Steroidobacteraceae bacterium]
MKSIPRLLCLLPVFGLMFVALDAQAQSFRVQCPMSTTFHPANPDGSANSNIKCQQIAGGDGYATMGDGNTIYLFGFGPLSGLRDIYNGLPGTKANTTFNSLLDPALETSTPSSLVGMPDGNFSFNGAIGLVPDLTQGVASSGWAPSTAYTSGQVVVNASNVYKAATSGTSCAPVTNPSLPQCTGPTATGTAPITDGTVSWVWQAIPPDSFLTGHVDPRPIMDVGVMNANQPAPLIAIDEDDELFLTLTNVGMIMRPDLFEQHTVHFHGYPNASAFYDGVPDASIAINVGGSFTYYYLAPDAGTYFWHCHIAPPEHLQMGMVGQLYVRPRQNKVAAGASLLAALNQWENAGTLVDPTGLAGNALQAAYAAYEPVRKGCRGDILCTTPIPAQDAPRAATGGYAYNDGDGTTHYDVEYPIQIHGFDPNFHFVGMTFNPESFNEMKDKYFMLNGRSYPDTVGGYVCGDVRHPTPDPFPACSGRAAGTVLPGPMETQSTDGTYHASQPLPTVINIPANGRALLRISDLDVTEYQTLASLGIPMTVVGLNARLLRDMAGNNLSYKTNSITLAGGESIDVILDATGLTSGQKFFLYTPNLDHLSNDAENFGGLMTEVNICSSVDVQTKACTI